MDYKQISQTTGLSSCLLAWDISIIQETVSCQESKEKDKEMRGGKVPVFQLYDQDSLYLYLNLSAVF